jgi:predicted cobalt transporter CbtA
MAKDPHRARPTHWFVARRSAIYCRRAGPAPGVLARVSVEERSLKIIMLAAVALFVVGAIAEARDTHTVWGQGGMFWMLLGFAAVALEFAVPRYAGRLYRR